MLHHGVAKTCSFLAAALTATAGALSLSAPAQADPTCDFQFGTSFAITQSDGAVVSASPSGPKNLAGGQKKATMSGGGPTILGNPNGKIVGDRLQLSVQWEGLGFRAFPGQISPDGSVKGIVQQVDRDVATYSSGPGTFKCVTTAEPAKPAPGGGAKGFGTAAVVADTDIYDKPDGKGQRIGTLFVGESHPLMEPCRDDWCRVGTIELGGFPGLPNGTAWVYAKGYLTFS
jgi:hypothetical protein